MKGQIILVVCMALLIGTGFTTDAMAIQKSEHEAMVKETLAGFEGTYENSDDVFDEAIGTLVCPRIRKIGFGVGLERGVCSLFEGDEWISFYRVSGASWGLIAGIQSHGMIMVFTEQKAYDNFSKKSKGWEIGVDGSVSVARLGVNSNQIDLGILKSPVVTFVIDQKGLMADLSIEGSRFKQVDLPEDAKGDLLSVVAIADLGSDRSTGATTRISIGVDAWTPAETRAAMITALRDEDSSAVKSMVAALEPCGVLKQVGRSEGVPLTYCAAARSTGGRFKVVLGASEPLGLMEDMQAAKREDLPVTQFIFLIDAHGEGEGVMLNGPDWEFDESELQVTVKKGSYDPVKLLSISAYDGELK